MNSIFDVIVFDYIVLLRLLALVILGLFIILSIFSPLRQRRRSLQRRLPQLRSSFTATTEKAFLHSAAAAAAAKTAEEAAYSAMDALAREPAIQSLGSHGYIQGSRLREPSTTTTTNSTTDLEKGLSASENAYLVRYFGGVRYALPPLPHGSRWGLARPLPDGYVYGTQESPGNCEGRSVPCPQLGIGDGDEDCFRCNVWVPEGEVPEGGWPVVFYIHGGFLQMGSPNDSNVARLLGETSLKCIFVAPAYRLAVLGFLSSRELMQEAREAGEPCGNQGFWDQRMALEWTSKYIHFFGGNAANITVAGYSAGSYSVFHQLAHDLYLPSDKAIIRRVIMFSNGPGVQPKSLAGSQEQFDELLAALGIPLSTPAPEKLALLRRTPVQKLIDASLSVTHHQYRPWNDGHFIPPQLFEHIDNGDFARRMLARNVRLMNGECRDEHFLYGTWHTPENSLESLRQRLEVDYPPEACAALVNLYYPDGKLPANCTDWQDAFGRIYADTQVHMLERGFVNALSRAGAAHLVFRYRIEYRVKCVSLPPDWGVTHSSDVAMWLWGNGQVLEDEEKRIVSEALIEPLARFVAGQEDVRWHQTASAEEGNVRLVRRLRPDGSVDLWRDEMWDRGVTVWEAVRRAQSAVMAKL